MTFATLEYIAAGANTHPSAAHWAPGLLAFGAGNNIALWNPDDVGCGGIYELLAGHSDAVTAIKVWDQVSRRVIISGSADKTIRLWHARDQQPGSFQQSLSLAEHAGSINALALLPEAGVFASGAADGTVKIWSFDGSQAVLQQSITLKPRYFPLALALATLPSGDVLLAVAGTSSTIQLYLRRSSGQDFELQASLGGHEGWVRGLDFTQEFQSPDSDILLASGSQDKYIRLWRICSSNCHKVVPSETVSETSSVGESRSLSNKTYNVGSEGSKCQVTFEALLIGHEDWVYTVRWAPQGYSKVSPTLLSASADNSLAVWRSEPASGLWVCNSRIGEVSSQKGSTTATGSTGGFWMGLWQPAGQSLVSLGRTGSWRKWSHQPISDAWVQQIGVGGHVQEVQALAWAPSGHYLLSTGSDQTTRLLAQWRRNGYSSWHEFSRPQIHGYDLNCIDSLADNQFLSGADEKLLRVFDKPKAIDQLVTSLGGLAASAANDLPDLANIPVLGLSNKAMTEADEAIDERGDTNGHGTTAASALLNAPALELEQPPFEDHLARHTLWPEHEKLYGHGYEISTVASNRDGSLVATACKASSIDHAVIRLYETKQWRELKPPLAGHNLTVTSLAFSADGEYLLSVGRDRQWLVHRKATGTMTTYTPHASNAKGHSRMILDCSWAPVLPSGHFFATAGRDKCIKIWKLFDSAAELVTTIQTGASTTATAFNHESANGHLLLAYGTEDGGLGIVSLDPETFLVREHTTLNAGITPSKTINSIRWRPAKDASATLAVASDDHSVRILRVSQDG